MDQGSGDNLIGGENSSGAGPLGTVALGDGAGANASGLSHCSASPEDTVQIFLEQVSSSYSSESSLLLGKITMCLKFHQKPPMYH